MKKVLSIFLASIFMLTAFCGCARRKNADVHVFYYTYSDTYISTVRSALDKALSEAGINVNMIDQGSSELNIIVGVENDDCADCIKAIYREFFN